MLASLVRFASGHLVLLLMFETGMAARPRDLEDVVRRPWFYARAMGVLWIGVPLLTIAAVQLFGLRRIPAELLLVMAVCPGAPFIPSVTKRQGRHHSIVGLDILIVCSLLAPLLLPAWLAILEPAFHFGLTIASSTVLARLFAIVLLPLFVGTATRVIAPRVADGLGRPVHYLFLAVFAVTLVAVLARGVPVLRDVAPVVFVAVAIIVVASQLLGYVAAGPDIVDRRIVSFAAVLGNPGLALAVASASHPGFKAAALIFAYLVVRALAMLPLKIWITHRASRTGAPRTREHDVSSAMA